KPKTSFDRNRKPEWKPKGSFDRDTKPAWKPKGAFDRDRKPGWKPSGSHGSKPAGRREWTPKGEKPHSTNVTEKLEWKPKGRTAGPASENGPHASAPASAPAKRKWVP